MAKDEVLEARFEMHEKQCVTDKTALWNKLDSIDNKLWIIGGAVIINLLVLVGYLITEGTPWEHKTVVVDRGERE
jgi:hypothetical protein